MKNDGISADSAFISLPDEISLSRICDEHFSKHLFEKAGYMNGEETDFAYKLDDLQNVEWWYRNREKEDFYLQGWQSNKFYPDYIVKLKNGNYAVVEYKGEDRISNDDTAYKVELGKLWERLNGKSKFFLVGKATSVEVIKSLSEL
jgi:type III restriction enzyme